MSYSNIIVTPSTSLILIKSIVRQPIVYLSSYNVNDFRVSIRDTTGLSSLISSPIVLSTIGGSRFLDNTTSYLITQPYGFANISLRTSSFWQVLHTSGQTPATAAANVGTTNISTTFFNLLSSASKRVSTLTIENLDTPNSITLTGPFVVGNLSTPGFILLKSTLNVYGRTFFDKNLYVSGPTQIFSTLSVQSIDTLSSPVFALSSVGVGGSVNVRGTTTVFSTLETRSSLLVQTVAVQKSTSILGVEILGNVNVSGIMSSLKSLDVEGNTSILGDLSIFHTISSLAGNFLTNSLNVGGGLTNQSSVFTHSAVFFSSLLTQSSLSIQTNFSTFSTATVTNIVSSLSFQTGLLSSATSFSTAGDFSILSTLTVLGNLSTQRLFVSNLFSTQALTVVRQSVSTTGTLLVRNNLIGSGSATLTSLTTLFGLGVASDATINSNVTTGLTDVGQLDGNSNLIHMGSAALFRDDVSVKSNLYVRGNMTVLGTPTITSFDVGSFEVSTLQITTSSPFVALQASTLKLSSLIADSVKLSYVIGSGDIQMATQLSTVVGASTQYSSLTANQIFSKVFQSYILSSQSLYTEQVQSQPSRLNPGSVPKFEIFMKASFPRGLSTPIVQSETATVTSTIGTFLGNAGLIVNTSYPPYSTLSAGRLTVSTVVTKVLSTNHAEFLNMYISTHVNVGNSMLMASGAAAFFLSTNVAPNPYFLQAYNTTRLPTVQAVDTSTIAINNVLYLDSGNRKVGVNISSPRYDLDISGSLFYTGQLYFSSQNETNLSTTKSQVYFSTILFSSIYINDSLILSQNNSFPVTKFLGVNSNTTNLFANSNILGGVVLSEIQYPQATPPFGATTRYLGIYTSPSFSTIDFNNSLFIHNDTKSVTYGLTIDQNNNLLTPLSGTGEFEFLMQGSFVASNVMISTLAVSRKLAPYTLEMPQLGINTSIVSTSNTISTSGTFLTINTCAQFEKRYFNNACFHINHPPELPFLSTALSVYSEAYVSSATAYELHAETIVLTTQTL